MTEAKFHIGLLKNYQLVCKPGTFVVSVAYTVREINLILGDTPRYLVPLRAMTSESLAELIKMLDQTDDKTLLYPDIKHLFLYGALWCNENDLYAEEDLPIKGEKVIATFDYVDTDYGKRLLCTHIELLPREELDYIEILQLDEFKRTLNTLITNNIS